MLVQEKVAGGKLICIDVELSNDRIARIKLTGDFFLHPEETIERIEQGLVGTATDEVANRIAQVLGQANAQLIGAAPEDLERLVKKAIA